MDLGLQIIICKFCSLDGQHGGVGMDLAGFQLDHRQLVPNPIRISTTNFDEHTKLEFRAINFCVDLIGRLNLIILSKKRPWCDGQKLESMSLRKKL